ncbi:MAG: uroporphyrinogen-III C-methyltransferase, partial [Pirellulales bacterium]
MTDAKSSTGKVYLVGAGPGDPGLITLRGVACLQRADVVLYDYLVNPEIVDHVPAGAQRISLGRHGHGRLMSQEEINGRIVDAARQGRVVVRLKAGDPAVFARAAEELEAVRGAGLPVEIVPGITAALAVGSYAGIPLTHRDLASNLALVAGRQVELQSDCQSDYAELARFPGTLVVYMGVTTAESWTNWLIDAGKSPSTPVAIVRRVSWPDQQVFRCSLEEVAEVLGRHHVRPPALMIVGDVAAAEETVDWFQTRPLFGKTVLVTRPRGQTENVRNRLAELGAQVLLQDAIRIEPPDDWTPVDRAIKSLGSCDWLVFSSANGVRYFMERLFDQGYDLRQLGQTRLAVIGPATRDALAEYRLTADLRPDQYRAEALAEKMKQHVHRQRVLLARASRGRQVLAEQLSEAGAHVEEIVVYNSRDVQQPQPEIVRALATGIIDWTTITSSAIARSLIGLLGQDLNRTRLVSISPLTSATLRSLGFEPAAEATT